MAPIEWLYTRRMRRTLVGALRGRVLEVGAGTGLNLPLYEDADRVTALEPDPLMMRRAPRRVSEAEVPVDLVQGDGQSLPFGEDTFDVVVSTLVFCSIPDPRAALREVARVARPEARILFVEHVRSPWRWAARIQEALTPCWKQVAGGCHLDRDTLDLVCRAGFRVERVRSLLWKHVLLVQALPPVREGVSEEAGT